MHTVVDLEAAVLDVLIVIVQVSGVLGAAKALPLAILVDAPQNVNSLIDPLLIAVLAEQGGTDRPESNILKL